MVDGVDDDVDAFLQRVNRKPKRLEKAAMEFDQPKTAKKRSRPLRPTTHVREVLQLPNADWLCLTSDLQRTA